MIRSTPLACVLTFAAACTGSPEMADVDEDAAINEDAGHRSGTPARPDGGKLANDAAVSVDAAAPRPDAGVRPDAGAAPDASQPAVPDASVRPDAAMPMSHPPVIDFGYYRVDTVPSGGAAAAPTVKGWTNLAYVDWYADARAFDYAEGADMSPVRANMDGILQRVTSQGLSVMMDVSYGNAWGPRLTKQGILATAAPYWNSVKYIILGDELTMSAFEANAALAELRTGIHNMGLAARPIGVTLTPDYVLSNPAPDILQASWDFINIEAYTPACSCGGCGDGTAQAEIAAISVHMAQQAARIPPTTKLTVVMQGYDRNGAFRNHDVLAEVNRATYFEMVKNNPRVLAVVVFNWQREGSTCAANAYPTWGHGTSGLGVLQQVHQEIWRDLTTSP